MEKKAIKFSKFLHIFINCLFFANAGKLKKIFFLACLYYEDYKFHPKCKMLGEETFFGKNIFERCYEYM